MSDAQALTVASPLLVPTATHLGPVHLNVRTAEAALAIWRDVVGLSVLEQSAQTIVLGTGSAPLIVLHPGASHTVRQGTAGLYHVAVHVPTRKDFARTLNRIAHAGVRVSPTDHLVSEALYLWDRDGIGIEITFETPWRGRFVEGDDLMAITPDGSPHSGREPIDVANLMAELDGDPTPMAPLPSGTRIGHVHVHVGDLDAAMGFYRDQLGFAGQLLSRRYGMGDVALDYAPHILAFNIWAGRGVTQPPAGSAGLAWFEIVMPDTASLGAMRKRLEDAGAQVSDDGAGFETADPFGNRVRVHL